MPKLNLLQQIPSEHLTLFLFFVHQAMMKRTTCIVAFLEYVAKYYEILSLQSILNSNFILFNRKMAPGCGPKLIEMGIPLFQTFGELSPNQFLELFMKLHSWEEFDHLFFESYVHDYTDYQ